MEGKLGWGIHTFLGQLAAGTGPVPSLLYLEILAAERDEVVQMMQLLLSIPFGVWNNSQRLLCFLGDMAEAGIPPLVDIPVETFAVRRTVCAILRDNHRSHLGGPPPHSTEI